MNEKHLKDNMIKVLKDTIYSNGSFGCTNNIDNITPSNCVNEVVMTKYFSKPIKQFLEDSMSTEIESKIYEINNYGESEDIVNIAHTFQLTEGLLETSRICIQDNLANTLDSCIKELDNLKCLNDSDLDISPLLQPEHVREVAECLSCENPLDVKINALKILLKSHMAEAVNAEGWPLLRKKLVDNLCDSNNEIFDYCLKIHVKLATSLLPEAIKECALNLLDCLRQYHYLQHGDSKHISLQNLYFYRMVHITLLLLQTYKETTVNVARFGENRLAQMIDNLIQLLSIHDPNKQSKINSLISPLEVISVIDPRSEWLSSLAHFAVLRKLLIMSLHKNTGFLHVIVEVINNWVKEPLIPNKNSSKILQGEITIPVQKCCLFIHCFSIFTTISTFCIRSSLFPIKFSNNEDMFTVENILKNVITLVVDAKFSAIANKKSTEMFQVSLAKNISSLLCLKGINGASYLTILLSSNDNRNPLDNKIIVKVLECISQHVQSNNPLIHSDCSLKRNPSLLHSFLSNEDHHPLMKQRCDMERQSSSNSAYDRENNGAVPFDLYLKHFIDKINKNTEVEELSTLFKIINNIITHFKLVFESNQQIKLQTIEIIIEMYNKLLESFKQSNTDLIHISQLHRSCLNFLVKVGFSTFGFNILQKLSVHGNILMDSLQDPLVDWTDMFWVMFVSKALTTKEGYEILSVKRVDIFRHELNKLWNTVEENCSGSELPEEDQSKFFFRLAAIFSLDLKGVKALMMESNCGSDITLVEECEVRPTNMFDLIQNYALNAVNCPNYFHHQFALTVLFIFSSNLDVNLFLQHKFNYQEVLLQLQSDNRTDEGSEVIIDECSILRHEIIEQSYLPGRVRGDTRPTHLAPRPESTLARVKTRFRGNGELARWLTETRSGLHDNNWLKHARKLHRNSYADEIKGSTILDLLEQVVKVLPNTRINTNWQNCTIEKCILTSEELLAIELVIRYGAHHRLVQSTQQNIDNLSQIVLQTKTSLNRESSDFFGFDWFVATAFLVCSGNIEKTQIFLNLILSLPTAQLVWLNLAEAYTLSQIGNLVEFVIAEEIPIAFQLLQNIGLSWWQLCCLWLRHCWWNVMDWSQICHWLTMSILHQADHTIYLSVALLHCNQDRLFQMQHQGSMYEIFVNPVDKFQLVDSKPFIDKLHKKYHNILHHHLAMIFHY